jgi:hypothetical protein
MGCSRRSSTADHGLAFHFMDRAHFWITVEGILSNFDDQQ